MPHGGMNGAEGVQSRTVYLDQCSYGQMLEGVSDWRESELGAVLTAGQSAGKFKVWASPTNVIETIQATETDRRRKLASMILELIEARRMWWGYEVEAIHDFFGFLRTFVQDAIRYPQYLEHHGQVAQQTWLGVLAVAAAVDRPHLGSVVEDLLRTKARNQLLHARFALAPDDWVDNMIHAAENLSEVTEDPLVDVEGWSTQQLTDEIDRLSKDAETLSKHDAHKLEKRREKVAMAYGGIEIGALLETVLSLPLELELTFNIPEIVGGWAKIQKATACGPIPEEIRTTALPPMLPDSPTTVAVIRHAVHAAARKRLMTTYLAFQVIIREMQRAMAKQEIPTGGLSFDAEHAVALKRFDIVVTRDTWFINTLKAMTGKIEQETDGQWRPQVATNAKQLQDALERVP